MAAAEAPQVLMEVRAIVHPSRQAVVLTGYRSLLMRPAPEGLLGTELLQRDAEWRVQLRWRSREALEAARDSARVTSVAELFRTAYADPVVSVLEVRDPGAA